MKTKLAASLLLLSLVVALGVTDANPQTAPAPAPCRIGYEAPQIGFWTWAANTRVKVYVVSTDFTAEQLPYLLTPLQNWNDVSNLTGSGVQFEYKGATARQLNCENCLTIMRGPVFDKTKRHATELRAYSLRGDQLINYAAIVIDPLLTNPKALRDATAHELGHNLGLLDCYTCKRKSTLMNQLKALNVPNDMKGPTACDIAQVRFAYDELKVRVRPSPRHISALGEDEGEEPVDDDTPIVVPKPY
jgi:hypothetical protein